jgi:hypothetical protein
MMKQDRTLQLERGEERLLHWLERYPFQRAQDLVVALSPWESRTVVYERLATLEQRRLIEQLHIGAAGGKRVWHLSPLGMYACDQLAVQSRRENQDRRARWERLGNAQIVRDEREKLVRLLPRLPVFLLLQDVVNGLVMHASSALTNQGRHAKMVQWSWQRDYGHAFLSPREKLLQVRVEGALALCLRFLPAERYLAKEDSQVQATEHWFTLFLLHCPLDEIRLIRMRLDRLLRWRESAERTAVYSQMPPLLVLATNERQAEWWHQAAVQVATRLRVNVPLGALACLPNTPEALENPWHLAFRRLGTKEFCHAQEVLHPLRVSAVPELLAVRGMARERTSVEGEAHRHDTLVALPQRLRLGAFALAGRPGAAQPGARIRPPHTWSQDYRLASVWLTPRHWEILRLFFAHPFLSRRDISHLLTLSLPTVNLLLGDLTRAQYLVSVSTPVDERWQLAEKGLHLLARFALCHVHRLVRHPIEDESPLEQRGAYGLLQQIYHTAGVYGFFAQLTEALATLSQAHLRWWETGAISERHFRYREKTYRFRPDSFACVQIGERQIRFWLEWDRGTMTPQDLQIKFATYAMYLTSREWASSSPYLPALLCVAPHSGQEQRLADAARQCLCEAPGALRVYTTTASLLLIRGILAPIWQQVILPQQVLRAPLKAVYRVAVFAESDASE